MKHNLLKSVIISVILLLGANSVWAATQRYIYVGISNNYQTYKNSSEFGFNFWGGTSGGVKSGTYIAEHTHDGRKYYMYRVQVYDDNNKAQFKGNNDWWEGECSVTLNGTTKNAVFFSHINDGWQGQFQENYQVTSTASLAASKTSVLVGDNVTLTPSLSSNSTYNTIKSTTYSISPNTGATISSNTFKATKAGTYTVTATVTYNAKDFTGITKTATATKTINVHETQYVLRGSINASGDPEGGMAGWGATNNNAYSVTTEGSTITFVANLTNAKTQYKFKIYNCFDGAYYGQQNDGEIPNNTSWILNGSNDVKFTTTAAGPYTFIYNTSDKSIKVQYPTAYTVTFSHTPTAAADAPTSSISSGAYVLANTSLTFTAKDAKTGYTWKGWYDNNAGTGTALSTNKAYTRSTTSNTTIYAVYTTNTYTVAFNANGGTGTMSAQNFTYGTAKNLTANTFTRTGYTFAGWNTKADGTETSYTDKQSVNNLTSTNGATVTLYAKWTANKYDITYKDQGNVTFTGTHAAGAPTKHTYGTATTLKTASKTGYTFGGWFTSQDCSGSAVTTLDATAYTSNITLYAKWTINQYTLTFLAGEGGEVTAKVGGNPISSPAALDYNTQVVLTATPTGENAFTRWVDGNGNQLSTANPYTHTFKATTTIKAEFSVPTTVYLKPEDYWKSDNACFAIVASATGKSDKKIDMESADCENIYYKVDIPAGYTEFTYVRLDPNNKNTIWNETGKLYAENAKGKMYVTPRIYLKPDNNWKSDNARFAVYFWKSSDINENTWRDLTSIGDDIYTCITPGESYDRAIFCRMDPAKSDNIWDNEWNQTNDLYIDHNSIEGKNLYTVTKADGNNMDGEIGEWHTHWETFAPTYTVTLDPFQYGTYGVIYDGKTYMSKKDESVIIDNVPLGAQIEVIDAKPTSPHYVANPRYKTSVVLQPGHDVFPLQEILKDQVIEICGNTCFASNLVTKDAHRVYLHIPQSVLNNWNTNNPNDNYVFVRDHLTNGEINNGKGALPIMTKDTYLSGLGDGEYWYCDIPAGYHTFRFERKKDNKEGTGCSNYTTTFSYGIPLTNFNCFTLNEAQNSSPYSGYWDVTPASTGDYRLLYVEQVVKKSEEDGDEWQTIVERTYTHTSDIIKKRTSAGVDTVSLHIYTRGSHPEVILQQFNTTTGEWDDIEAHMVNGPLEATPDKAMLPGRKNAGIGSSVDDFVYDDGIEVIKADEHDDGCGVWNFPVEQDGKTATLNLLEGHLKRYTGEYYIRTDNAEGGWEKYTLPGNYMTYSQYAKDHSGFSHYFCKWVEVSKTPNTKFVIANDYGVAISDTLDKDDYTDQYGTIAYDANIRWSWDIVTNNIARAYIQGTWDVKTSTRNENLVAWYTPNSGGTSTKQLLDDSGDWIYQYDVTVKVGSVLDRLIAEYPVGSSKIQTFAENLNMLIGDPVQTDDYVVRILYDFKINKTIVALVPNDKVADIEIDVLIERVDQDPATQVQAQVNATRSGGATVYAVMSFTKDHIKGSASKYAKQFYWISFPFDVRVSDVFGFGEYGKHWIIQWYDGAERAKNGCWIDSPTYWRFQTDTTGYILQAGKGYVLTLDLDEMDVFTNTNKVSLYFPSQQTVRTVDQFLIQDKSEVTLEPYTCTIERNDRKTKDSHWHMLGVPSFANKNMTFRQDDIAYFYEYDSNDDTYDVKSSGKFDFQSMFSYMVQYAGTMNWNEFFTINSQGLAAKRNTDVEDEQFELMIQLRNANESDQTFVQMREEGATEMFDMNLDLTKMLNSRINIYSLIQGNESNIEVAGNVMPIEETIIPLGVQVKTAGEYTFAMPDGTDGIVVELIDYETNTRTNMLLDNYTVTLGKGTFDNRFALHVQPSKVTTSVEDINTNSNVVKKYLIDGILYMQKDGVLYDAQGKLVR